MRIEDLVERVIHRTGSFNEHATTLDLSDVVRFRRRTRHHPYDFSDFLNALVESDYIRVIRCHADFSVGLTAEEWLKVIKAFGKVKNLVELRFLALPKSGHSMKHIPFAVIAESIQNARGLRTLIFDRGTAFEGDSSSFHLFAESLKHHPTLERFWWKCDQFQPTWSVEGCFDPIALALSTCPKLEDAYLLFTSYAGVESYLSPFSVQTLTEATPRLKHLSLTTRHWPAVALGLEHRNCAIQRCSIGQSTATLSDIQALCKALENTNEKTSKLRHLQLVSGTGFDDSMGTQMAEALKTSKGLEVVEFHDSWVCGGKSFVRSFFREPTYIAFSECLQINFDIRIVLKVGISKDDDPEGNVAPAGFHNFKISSILNRLGRKRLCEEAADGSNQGWLPTLVKLNDSKTYDSLQDSEALAPSCIFSLLRSNPNILCCTAADTSSSSKWI